MWGTQGSAKGAGAGPFPGSTAGPLSGASLTPQMAQVPCCCPNPPMQGCLLPLQALPHSSSPGCQRALGCQLPHPCPLRCP